MCPVLPALCATLLLLSLCPEIPALVDIRSGGVCCPRESFVKHKIPHQIIKRYKETISSCPRRAYILVLKKGKQCCVETSATWITDYISKNLI